MKPEPSPLIHLIAPRSYVSQEMREVRQSHRGMAFWLTGLSGSGKSTLAHAVEAKLFEKGYNVIVLDGDVIRSGLCQDLGFSPEERKENNRRIAEVTKIFVRNGTVCLCAFISPTDEFRKMAKEIIGTEYFREIFVSCSVEECERRDEKGFYKKARQGEIKGYTGVSAGFERPCNPDCTISTENALLSESIDTLHDFVIRNIGQS